MSSGLLDDLRLTTRQALSAAAGGDVVDQLDLAGMLLNDEHGGLGLGDREMVLVSEEIGRSTSASSFLPTAVLAATLLAGSDGPGAAEVLSALAATKYAVALAGPDGAWTSGPSSVHAAELDGGWELTGTVWALTTPTAPDAVVLAASGNEGTAIFVIDSRQAMLQSSDAVDPSRGLVEVVLDKAKGRRMVGPAAAADALRAAYRRAVLAISAEQLGVARACLELTVEYAKTRSQFGAPIGSFQSIKHRCADVLLGAELADAVLQQALDTATVDDAELAFIVATRAALDAAESCIHVHGGIGFTWEHPAHWYFRRARVNATLLGGPGVHRAAIAKSAGITATEGMPS